MKRTLVEVAIAVALLCASASFANAAIVLAKTDFGSGDYSTDVSPFTTSYTPFSGPTSPGHYGVAKSGSGYDWSSFDWGGQDHTNPGTGRFMVIDGAENSSLAIISYTTNTMAGASYTLTGWAQTVQSQDGPDVTLSFRVNGVEQGTFTFSGATEWVWNQFTFTYTATTSGPTTFAIHDNQTSHDWNDFGLDDLVLSTTAPILLITMNKASYSNGDTIAATVFRLQNLGLAVASEVKVWLGVPGIDPIGVFNIGSDGSFMIPAGFDHDFGPFTLGTVTAALPRGTYEFSSRIIDPVTGIVWSEDLNPFMIQ